MANKHPAPRRRAAKNKKAASTRVPRATPEESTAPLALTEEPEDSERDEGFPIVGIGASAGGLEAFSEVLRHLPSSTGMAYVFVQHLDPLHTSMLRDLLQRQTKMPVVEVMDGMQVEPDRVYVIPRNTQMTLSGGMLRLAPRQSAPVPNMPIDPFLRSLASDRGSKAIGVILSGNASDGTLGIRAIKAAGGITFAQTSESAKHDGMPRSAVSAGSVDFVLAPSEMAKELARLGQHPYIARPVGSGNKEQGDGGRPTETMLRILALLRTATGTDFTYYKRSTIGRRIHRRMALRRIGSLEGYLSKLRSEPAEIHALHEDMLINVTEFFRDPEVFEALKEVVFPKIVPERGRAGTVRIWVPGCATGEEVYSIAMSLLEYLEVRRPEVTIQLFGTDLSDTALEKARAGVYPRSVVQSVSSERLRRFFGKVNSNYRISKNIREMCIFARQDLVKDAPFSKLHLISCRNVLIYLGPMLQKRVMPVLHYALRPNGFLLLGKSETISTYSDLFAAADRKSNIYTRRAGPAHMMLRSPAEEVGSYQADEAALPADWTESEMQREADRIVLGRYGPPGVVVDDGLNIVLFRGHTGPYLEPSTGAASLNIFKMAREGLATELRNAVIRARKTQAAVRVDGLRLRSNSTFLEFSIEVIPLRKLRTRRFLILFHEGPAPAAPRKAAAKSTKKFSVSGLEKENAQLRQELAATKEYMQSIIEEQEASNEELRSANEEIQSSNEELQSTNEELETAKEELQSTNEEVNTVNEELQTRNQQLAQAMDDLNNLLANVNIPIVMLQTDLRIRRFTPISGRVLNLIPSDVGRPISDINLNLDIPNVDKTLAEVIETLTPKTLEVKDLGGRLYSLRIRPYRTEENKIDGVVMVLVDLDPGTERSPSALVQLGETVDTTGHSLNFSTGLLYSQERERQRLSRELHDDFNQRLAALAVSLGSMQRGKHLPQEIAGQLASIREGLGSIADDLQRVAYRLHPSILDHRGLVAATETLVQDFRERYDLRATFEHTNVPDAVAHDTALCLYRVTQEALHNVGEHADAKSVQINLSCENKRLLLTVRDDGLGFDTGSKKHGLGLRSMQERVSMAGGSFEVESGAKGTTIRADVPLPPPVAELTT